MSDILPSRNSLSAGEEYGHYFEIKALKDNNNRELSNILKDLLFALKNNPSQKVVASAREYVRDLKMLKQKYETGTYRKAPKAQIYTKREDLIKHIEDMTEDFDNLSDESELYSEIRKLLGDIEEEKKELLVNIDRTTLPDGASIDETTGNIEINIASPILGIVNTKLNGNRCSDRDFTVLQQKFIIKTHSILETIFKKTNVYEIVMDIQGGEQIMVIMEVEKKGPGIWIKSLSIQSLNHLN